MTAIAQREKFNWDSPDGLPERQIWDSEEEDADDYIEED